MKHEEPSLIECASMIEEHYRHGNPRAELIANLMISIRQILRRQDSPKGLEQMTTREIIELVDTMFPR